MEINVTTYPLKDANAALNDLRVGNFEGAGRPQYQLGITVDSNAAQVMV